MTQFSYTKISNFEKCPLAYKFKYIDKIKSEKQFIEGHLGSSVHSSLEWLYKRIINNNLPDMDSMLNFFSAKWQENSLNNFIIVKEQLTTQDYFDKGIKFLLNYYTKNYPFNENTIELEKKIKLKINETDFLIGFIDRLSYHKDEDYYEIHDYKTSNSPPSKKDLESEKQLPIYSLAIKERTHPNQKIKLSWHFLSIGEKVTIEKSLDELNKIKKTIQETISKIKNETIFPPKISILCKWCEYNDICPEYQNFSKGKYKKEINYSQDSKNQILRYPTTYKYIKD